MNESMPELPLTDQDQADLMTLLGEDTSGERQAPDFHPILEVWKEVLAPAQSMRDDYITPMYANRIIGTYPEITFKDMPRVQSSYFDKIEELRQILLAEIESDPDCLTYTSAEEDLANNAQHYKALLFDWQIRIVEWEREWLCTNDDAAVELAAIGEIFKMFFGDMGLTAHLSSIQFNFSESDQEELIELLNAAKEGRNSE